MILSMYTLPSLRYTSCWRVRTGICSRSIVDEPLLLMKKNCSAINSGKINSLKIGKYGNLPKGA